jgi:hypothetical protein
MPLINGRFYANPAYGQALERARAQEAARVARHDKHAQTPAAPNDPLANRIYNESSGLRPSTSKGPGSTEDLHNASVYIGHVIRNREVAGAPVEVAPDHLRKQEAQAVTTYPPARQAYQDSKHAAQSAHSQLDPTGGAQHFYLDSGKGPPKWAVGKKPVATFGPFINPAGGGDVPRGAEARIVILR